MDGFVVLLLGTWCLVLRGRAALWEMGVEKETPARGRDGRAM